ncbi:PQQ-binding-like beta-propeller repeat protein [Streptomyces sp. TRM68416]|uniref:outer membrane protein assembly factor BamB family protein n=1 Tax=Streptomyces sp. TRM68416 TaxID=2758412 RepID=UPI00166199EB|nr:PQQ-binding-like beta-propeller repeat protein [Streptomyces sp. TRM68416]MBD0838340.1 PQQ-binding-like beta-propeller repeat protein [Streptomyces sp. TRM68416]
MSPEPITPPEGPARRGPRRAVSAGLAFLLVVLAVALGAGGWALWAGTGADDGPGLRDTVEKVPADTAAESLFTIDAPELSTNWSARSIGSWATESTYVKTGHATVDAYAVEDGERRWRLSLPGEACAAAQHVTSEGLTAVVTHPERRHKRRPDLSCDQLVVFDVDNGRKVWQTTLARVRATEIPGSVSVGHGVVVASWYEGAAAYRVDDGEALWTRSYPDACPYSRPRFTGGTALVGIGRFCTDARPRAEREVRKVDPRTGRDEWIWRIPDEYITAGVLSNDPVTVAVSRLDPDDDHEETLMTHVVSLDSEGKPRAVIPVDDRFDIHYWDSRQHTHAATDDTLFLPVRQTEKTMYADEIVAIDLDTGKVRKRFPAQPGRHLAPLRMNGDRLLALQVDHRAEKVVKVFSIDPATGEKTLMLRAATKDEDIQSMMRIDSAFYSEALFQHGRLFFSRSATAGPYRAPRPIGSRTRPPVEAGDRYTAVAFGVPTR